MRADYSGNLFASETDEEAAFGDGAGIASRNVVTCLGADPIDAQGRDRAR
jgi:hypothetical protein